MPAAFRTPRIALLTVLIAGALPAGSVHPEEDPQMAELMALLNTPVVTASKTAQKAGDAPATVTVVTQEQIKRRGYRSLLQVLGDLPDIKVDYRSDVEWFADVTVRGVPGHDKFVVLLDGVRISPPTNEQIPLIENYPVHLAKQIEVVYGPASALYGADAVSGVVNIITRDSARDGEANLMVDADGLRLANVFWTREFGSKTKFTLAGQWMLDPQPDLEKAWDDFQDFAPQRANAFDTIFGPMSATVPYNSDPEYPNRTQALFAALQTESFRFTFFRNAVKTSTSALNSPDNAIYTEDAFIGHGVTVAGATYTHQIGNLSLTSSLTGSLYELNPNSMFRNAYTGMNPGYKYAASSSWKVEQQAIWTPSSSIQLTAGIGAEHFTATPWSTDLQAPVDTSKALSGTILGTPLEADFFNLRYKNLGAFLQGQFNLTPTLIATVGARYDDNSRYGDTVNPRLGLVYHLNDSNTVKVLYGSAFLAPSPYAAYAHFGSFFTTDGGLTYQSFYWRLPNPGLKPIKERALEVSYRTFLPMGLGITINAYRTELRNLYALSNDATTTQLYNGQYKGWPVAFIEVRTNLGEQTNTGGTIQVDYLKTFGSARLNAYASYSHVDGDVDPLEDGHSYDIPLIAPNTWRAGVELTRGTLTGSLRLLSMDRQRMAPLDTAGKRLTIKGYSTLDLACRWAFSPKAEAFLTVRNALDSRYRNVNPHGVVSGGTEMFGSPQDPRRITLGLTGRF